MKAKRERNNQGGETRKIHSKKKKSEGFPERSVRYGSRQKTFKNLPEKGEKAEYKGLYSNVSHPLSLQGKKPPKNEFQLLTRSVIHIPIRSRARFLDWGFSEIGISFLGKMGWTC